MSTTGDTDRVARSLAAIVRRTGISYSTLAHLAGVSVSTARHVLATGEMPKRATPRQALTEWVTRNRGARSREELRLA